MKELTITVAESSDLWPKRSSDNSKEYVVFVWTAGLPPLTKKEATKVARAISKVFPKSRACVDEPGETKWL